MFRSSLVTVDVTVKNALPTNIISHVYVEAGRRCQQLPKVTNKAMSSLGYSYFSLSEKPSLL